MDFAALPPEVNSWRMYTGPGSAPLMEAASGWSTTSAQLTETAEGIRATLCSLTASWLGPSARLMAAAGDTYVSWLTTLAGQASETGSRAMAAAGAFQAALAATVPPVVISANRALLASLVATNYLGINTPAIMATELQYVEMWAQDVAAMTAYQIQSAQAAVLPPFSPLGALTNAVQDSPLLAGLGLDIFSPQSATATDGLAGLLNFVTGNTPSALGSLLNSTVINSLYSSGFWFNVPTTALQSLGSLLTFGSLGQGQQQIEIAEANAQPNTPIGSTAAAGGQDVVPPAGEATATVGTAGKVGSLSTPQSWGPTVNPAAITAESIGGGTPEDATPMAGIIPAGGNAGSGSQTTARDRVYGFPVKSVIPRHPSAG